MGDHVGNNSQPGRTPENGSLEPIAKTPQGPKGGLAVHILDLVHWALDLQHPTTIEADSNPKGGSPESYPAWLTARWE